MGATPYRAGARSGNAPHERNALRRREADRVEEPQQAEIVRCHDRLDPLDPQRAEIGNELRDERVPDAPMAVIGVHADTRASAAMRADGEASRNKAAAAPPIECASRNSGRGRPTRAARTGPSTKLARSFT